MKGIKTILLILIILINSIMAVGCWNYKEVDKLNIVAGVAVDKGESDQYRLTVEIVHISGGKETKTTSKIISSEWKTMFDAVRNVIAFSSKRLYWAHAKILIISREVAVEKITNIIDWYNRDSETRSDVHILISQGNTAAEILRNKGLTEEIKSFVLDEMLKNYESLSKAPLITMFQFNNDLQAQGMSAIAPAVYLKKADGELLPHIMGTAIFKNGKLVSFLSGEETKDLLFIKNKVKGGLLIEGVQDNDITTPVSLEVFESKTRITPVVEDEDIKMNIEVDTTAAIDEIGGTANFINEEGRMKLEHSAEKTLRERIEALIDKVQSDYGADIFGFGDKLREDKNEVWDSVSSNWEETFRNLEVNVTTNVHIRNSASLSKPLKVGY